MATAHCRPPSGAKREDQAGGRHESGQDSGTPRFVSRRPSLVDRLVHTPLRFGLRNAGTLSHQLREMGSVLCSDGTTGDGTRQDAGHLGTGLVGASRMAARGRVGVGSGPCRRGLVAGAAWSGCLRRGWSASAWCRAPHRCASELPTTEPAALLARSAPVLAAAPAVAKTKKALITTPTAQTSPPCKAIPELGLIVRSHASGSACGRRRSRRP